MAVVASIVIMALETFALPEGVAQALFVADVTLSLVFVAEYLFRVATAENRRGYVTSFFGIIDLVAISPIFLHAAASVRVVRLLRVLRILRLLKLKRYDEAIGSLPAGAEVDRGGGDTFHGCGFHLHHQLRLRDL